MLEWARRNFLSILKKMSMKFMINGAEKFLQAAMG